LFAYIILLQSLHSSFINIEGGVYFASSGKITAVGAILSFSQRRLLVVVAYNSECMMCLVDHDV